MHDTWSIEVTDRFGQHSGITVRAPTARKALSAAKAQTCGTADHIWSRVPRRALAWGQTIDDSEIMADRREGVDWARDSIVSAVQALEMIDHSAKSGGREPQFVEMRRDLAKLLAVLRDMRDQMPARISEEAA